MTTSDVPESVQQFIFEAIDSVEQLDVLLLLRNKRDRAWSSASVNAEIRSSTQSVMNRLIALEQLGLLVRLMDGSETFRYEPKTSELDAMVAALAEVYRIRPQKIYELIFSPLKKSRHFAAAFVFKSAVKTKKDSDNG